MAPYPRLRGLLRSERRGRGAKTELAGAVEAGGLSAIGIESHAGLRHYGLYDTVVALED